MAGGGLPALPGANVIPATLAAVGASPLVVNAAATILGLLLPHNRSIGGIIAQVTIEESHDDTIQITEHPVEQGAPINDHAFKKPASVTIRVGWSNSGPRSVLDLTDTGMYGQLLRMQVMFVPFDIYTGKRVYTNMLIERIAVTTDQHSEHNLIATLTCREIFLVKTSTTTVTAMSDSNQNQTNPEGNGSTGDSGDRPPENKGTVLGTTNDVNVEQLGTPQPRDPNAVAGPADYQIGPSGSTPTAQTVEGSMVVNQAEAPNSPAIPPADLVKGTDSGEFGG